MSTWVLWGGGTARSLGPLSPLAGRSRGPPFLALAQRLEPALCSGALAAYKETLTYDPENAVAKAQRAFCETRLSRLGTIDLKP